METCAASIGGALLVRSAPVDLLRRVVLRAICCAAGCVMNRLGRLSLDERDIGRGDGGYREGDDT
jgi:hypothetical protein